MKTSINDTLIFTFSPMFASQNDVIDYWIDVDDESRNVYVHVDDVDHVLVNNMSNDELCSFFGMDTTYLLTTNREVFVWFGIIYSLLVVD